MKQYAKSVYINGIGVMTPFGNSLQQVFDSMINSDIKRTRCEILNKIHHSLIESENKLVDYEERFVHMCEYAIKAAVDDWSEEIGEYDKITLVLGSGLGLADSYGYYPENVVDSFPSLREKLMKRLDFISEVIYFSNACSASSQAICYGADLIGYGEKELVIVGGADIFSPIAYAGFQRLNAIEKTGCKPFDTKRSGISVGEGAAFYILQSHKSDKSYAVIGGYGCKNEGYDVVRMNPEGKMIIEAMAQAVDMAGIRTSQINLIVAHGTGTLLNDNTEARAIEQYFSTDTLKTFVTAPKGVLGHTGGASGALGVLIGIGSINYGIIPPIVGLEEIDPKVGLSLVYQSLIKIAVDNVMINCFAFGGTDYVIIIKSVDQS